MATKNIGASMLIIEMRKHLNANHQVLNKLWDIIMDYYINPKMN